MRMIFIRHGDPDYVKDSLTEKGWREAKLLAERVRKWEIEDIYCSPLGRAKATASCSLEKLGREATVYDWLQEFPAKVFREDLGRMKVPWDLKPSYWTKEEAYYDKDLWTEADLMKTAPVREAYQTICEGIDGLLLKYGYERKDAYYVRTHPEEDDQDKTIVFFCHLGVMLAIIGHLIGAAAPVLWHGFFVAPTSVTVLASEELNPGEAYFRCQVLGDTRHLYEGGEPISSSGFFTKPFQG
ncbi:MAG: histidine phosphatase family protein [Lachnospiraceae bacterium]|nr:histidine phosphatase family protein [Robinsoniella sp.]MDY3765890.1 histidine phosphatase family protein [Lachnospiraceae bacterium]